MLGTIFLFGLFGLTALNWWLYHKIFRVYYFGNIGNSLIGEFAGSLFATLTEMMIVIFIYKKFGGIIMAIAAIILICIIVNAVKKKKG